MDVLNRLLLAIDGVRTLLASRARKHADDYYELVAPVDDVTLQMNDGSLLSFFELRGFARLLTNEEKKEVSKKIAQSINGIMRYAGYNIQIVDLSDPQMTQVLVSESMQRSIEELRNMGLDHPVLTTDYVAHIARQSVWKKQYLILQTTPMVFTEQKMSAQDKTPEQKADINTSSDFIEYVMKTTPTGQVLFETNQSEDLRNRHRSFCKITVEEMSQQGALLSEMKVGEALLAQKTMLYGPSVNRSWKPVLGHVGVCKDGDAAVNPGGGRIETPNMVEQVVTEGGSEEGLPEGIIRFGGRYFSTFSMVLPQQKMSRLETYDYLSKRLKGIGYMASFRIFSGPFRYAGYSIEQIYAGLSGILPMTNNGQIRLARTTLRDQHDGADKTVVFLQMTLCLFSDDLQALKEKRIQVASQINAWNEAKFRPVEQDRLMGIFDSVGGATKHGHYKMVMENLADCLYQSPFFATALPYTSGYLHFLTEDGQPFPFQPHSALNMNYNRYVCGAPGSGKSTLLTMLNIALLAQPKTNPEMKGVLPVIIDIDFGKTSFGYKEFLQQIVDERRRSQFLLHEMGVDVNSAINPHDLPLGRTTPTVRQKLLLARFLLVLIAGVDKHKDGSFSIRFPDMEPMLKYLIDAVYAYRQEDASPRMFREGEFRHEPTLRFLKSIGITPNEKYSYWSLADAAMKAGRDESVGAAILLRRYAVPVLGDYVHLLTNNNELGSRYSTGVVSQGMSPLAFFMQRMGDVQNEFPCFTRPTRVGVDLARMISLDIKNVCGENDYRKAVFGSMGLMMFLMKRENLEESDDLMQGVKELYQPYLQRLDKMNRVLPGALNIEEAHVLFALFNDLLISIQRHNRKGGWGLTTLSQNLTDPTTDFMSVCGSLIVVSNQNGEKVPARLSAIQASEAEKRVVSKELVNRAFFLYIQTTSAPGQINFARIGSKLHSSYSPGLLWVSNSEQADRDFRSVVFKTLGYATGLQRLTSFFPGGAVRGYFNNPRLLELASERGCSGVFDLLMKEITTLEAPSVELARNL